MLEFVMSWWGLIALAVIFLIKLLVDYEVTVKMIRDLIFTAEEHARHEAIKTAEEKFAWVVEHGYYFMPKVLRAFISKELFAKLVQAIFDGIMDWTKEKHLR